MQWCVMETTVPAWARGDTHSGPGTVDFFKT